MSRARTSSNDARTERSVLAFVSRPLAVLVGVASLSFAAYSALVGASTSSADWTPTPCEILASRVASGPTQELRADGAFRGSGGVPVAELKSFEPLVTYRYSVHGAEHESSCVSLAPSSFPTEADARAFVARFPVGAASTCFVDPAAPERAVLDRGTSHSTARFVAAAIAVLVAATSLAFAARNSGRIPSKAA